MALNLAEPHYGEIVVPTGSRFDSNNEFMFPYYSESFPYGKLILSDGFIGFTVPDGNTTIDWVYGDDDDEY